MRNKIKKPILPPKDDLFQICQEIAQNKQQIQSFCARNRMKFPLITHPRSPIHQIPASRMLHSLYEQDNPEYRRFQSENTTSQETTHHRQFQRKSSICRIVFSKSHKKNPTVSLHSGLMRNTDSKVSLLNGWRMRRRSEDRFNESKMPDYSTRLTHLQDFINSIDHIKSKGSLSHSVEVDRKKEESRFQLLSINRMSTIDPQAELLQTLRGKNLHLDRTARQTSKRYFNPKDLSRISFYKNADGIPNPKRTDLPHSHPPKDPATFQPWPQGNQLQEDYMSELQK